MNKHFRAALAAAASLALGLALAGCSLVSVNEDKDRAQIVAKVGDMTVTKGDYEDAFNQTLSYYQYFGQDPTSSADQLKSFQDNILDSLVKSKVEEYQAKKQGHATPNAEDQKKLDDEVNNYMTQWEDEARTQAQAEDASASSVELDARVKELFPTVVKQYIGKELDQDATRKWLVEQLMPSYLIEELQADFNSKITVTDDEVKAAFDKQLESDKSSMESDPSQYADQQHSYEQYVADQASGSGEDASSAGVTLPPLVVPEGYIRVKHIKIVPDKELGTDYTDKTAQMSDLESQIGKLSTTQADQTANAAKIADLQSQYSSLKAEADKLKADVFAPAKAKADEAYAKLTGGAAFDDVLKEYTSDSNFTDENSPFLKTGTLLSDKSTDWSDAIKSAALALTAPGTYTGIVEDDDGYHILQFVGAETPGERKLEDYKDLFRKSTLADKQADEWTKTVDAWSQDTTVVTKYDSLIRDVGKSA